MKQLILLSFLIVFNINAEDQTNIDALLDGLHEDAHKGNFEAYFDRYSSDAVFLGTDKTERWTIQEFKSYAKPAFADGHGWTYKVIERNWEGGGKRSGKQGGKISETDGGKNRGNIVGKMGGKNGEKNG